MFQFRCTPRIRKLTCFGAWGRRMSSVRPAGDFGTWLLEVPAERVIALARVALAALALVAVQLDPTQPANYATETHLILVCYLAFALAALWADQARRISSASLVATYLIDLLTVTALMRFTQGVAILSLSSLRSSCSLLPCAGTGAAHS